MALVLVRGSMLRVLLSLLAAASPSSGLVLPRSSTTPAIHPPAGARLQVLSDEPRVVLVEGLLSGAECDALVSHASEGGALERSNAPAAQFDSERLARGLAPLLALAPLPRFAATLEETGGDVGAALAAGGGALGAFAAVAAGLAAAVRFGAQRTAAAGRTSAAVALNDAKDKRLSVPVVAKLARLLGAAASDFEAPVVTRYGEGDHFATHNDASAQPERDWGHVGGQRLATCILYLNDVDQGGETDFDVLGVRVAPRKGAACVFFPAHADTHRPDERTTHASLPAVDEKWICQVWRRARPVPPPLGLPS